MFEGLHNIRQEVESIATGYLQIEVSFADEAYALADALIRV
ncbi:MAG: hypothetical protein ACLVJ6_01430 [Merdibacter sp.]